MTIIINIIIVDIIVFIKNIKNIIYEWEQMALYRGTISNLERHPSVVGLICALVPGTNILLRNDGVASKLEVRVLQGLTNCV